MLPEPTNILDDSPRPCSMNNFRILSEGYPNPRVDIVFVHGLGGDARKTWTHKRTEHFWPEDSLAKDIPDARIMTYSYNTKLISVRKPVSTSNFNDHAKTFVEKLAAKRVNGEQRTRNVIFIARGLGGLLTAQALQFIEHDVRPHVKQITSCTIGMLLFGVPFGGSGLAGPAKLLTVVFKLLGVNTVSRDMLGVLRVKSELRNNIQEFLTNLVEKYKDQINVLTIVEELRTFKQEVYQDEALLFHFQQAKIF